MIRSLIRLARTHIWGIVLVVVPLLGLAACNETVVDEDSARVIKRGIDTLILHDSTTLYDTLIVADTLYSIDTLFRYDTVIQERLIVKVDTIFRSDTIRLTDTIGPDTVTVRDTIINYDTVQDTRGEFTVEGWLYKRDLSSIKLIDSLPIVIDRASLLELKMNTDGFPEEMELRLTARLQKPPGSDIWGERTPALIYLLAGRMGVPVGSNPVRKELSVDPRFGASGIAVVTYPAQQAVWFATGVSGNEGSFWINRIDREKRVIYTSFRARFSYPESFAIDSAAMVIRY